MPLGEYYDVRVGIVEFLLENLALPAPNVAHLLLGFDTTRPTKSTVLQGTRAPPNELDRAPDSSDLIWGCRCVQIHASGARCTRACM